MTGHLDIKDLEKMKKDDLKALAKDMGISDEGTVKELAARIAAEEVEVPEEDELTEEEKLKYEIAEELGLLDRVMNDGWKSLSSKETGRIGGMVNRRRREKKTGE